MRIMLSRYSHEGTGCCKPVSCRVNPMLERGEQPLKTAKIILPVRKRNETSGRSLASKKLSQPANQVRPGDGSALARLCVARNEGRRT